jgi:signal transduction histidine kinase
MSGPLATLRQLRVHPVALAIACLLLALSLWEVLASDELDAAVTFPRLVGAAVPPVLVALARRAPERCAAVLVAVHLFESVPGPPAGTLGSGFAMLFIPFFVASWSARPAPWLLALLLSGTVRDLQVPDFESVDMMIDWAFLLMSALAGLLVRQRNEQARRLSSHLELVDDSRQRVVDEAVARERAQIARELHDVGAHSVSLMVVQAGTAVPRAHRVDAELAQVLATVERAGREALVELRRLLGVLRAVDDTSDGMAEPVPGLDDLAALVERARLAGLDVALTATPVQGVAPGVGLCAYRVVQEGLTNALRHSSARAATVTVTGRGTGLLVRVESRGTGGVRTMSDTGSGVGLVGLRERVLLCGGTLRSGPDGEGFVLEATLPLEPAGAVAAGQP